MLNLGTKVSFWHQGKFYTGPVVGHGFIHTGHERWAFTDEVRGVLLVHARTEGEGVTHVMAVHPDNATEIPES